MLNNYFSNSRATLSSLVLIVSLSACSSAPKTTSQAFYDGIERNQLERELDAGYSTPPEYYDSNVNDDDVKRGAINAAAQAIVNLFSKD